MSLILPKGIVVNTPEISGDIGRIDDQPLAPDEIAKLWKVYTTTKRRLLDPTAERLENLFWRIWNSRQRNLRGATVAKLFSDISDGRSFTPLLGPPNRYDPGGQKAVALRQSSRNASTTEIDCAQASDSADHRQSSSAVKISVDMPPPILKKNRGPSATGPRPTARFVSPRSSEDEIATDSTSTGGSKSSHVVGQSSTSESQAQILGKKASVPNSVRKKGHQVYVATTGHKRRHGLAKRPSSQSSAGSDPIGSAQDSAQMGSFNNGKPGNCPPETLEEPARYGKPQMQSKFQENSSSALEQSPGTKTSQKVRPVKEETSEDSLGGSSAFERTAQLEDVIPKVHRESTLTGGAGSSGRFSTLNLELNESTHQEESKEVELQGSVIAEANARLADSKAQGRKSTTAGLDNSTESRDQRSNQAIDSKAQQDVSIDLRFPKDMKSVASTGLARINTDATKVKPPIDEQLNVSANRPQIRGKAKDVEVHGHLRGQEPPPNDLFAKRPVQPIAKAASALFATGTKAPTAVLSKSKSQLTLLLEKDKLRAITKDQEKEQKRKSGEMKGKKDR